MLAKTDNRSEAYLLQLPYVGSESGPLLMRDNVMSAR